MIDVGTACYVEHGEMPDSTRNTAVAAYDVEFRLHPPCSYFSGRNYRCLLGQYPIASSQILKGHALNEHCIFV